MRKAGVLAILTAVPLLGAASTAHAQSQALAQTPNQAQAQAQILRYHDLGPEIEPVDETTPSSQPWSPPIPHKTLQLDSQGRWGVRLDMEQPNGREVQMKDVQAGAYFTFGPRIRVGGSVGLGDKFDNPQRLTPQEAAPRVHLETAFKF